MTYANIKPNYHRRMVKLNVSKTRPKDVHKNVGPKPAEIFTLIQYLFSSSSLLFILVCANNISYVKICKRWWYIKSQYSVIDL